MSVVGEIRPSQLMFTFGVGATLDLPEFSALVMGLDYWNRDLCRPIVENRLLAAVQRIVGLQLRELRLPPVQEEENDSRGVPVVPFPRWMRCSVCGALAPLDDDLFEKRESPYQSARFVHAHCDRMTNPRNPPRAIPVRFLLACPDGHLSDVPWNDFIHDGAPCARPDLHMNEFGITGDISDIMVSCACGKRKPLSALAARLRAGEPPYVCSGLHPHLRQRSATPCEARPQLITLGASNLWFPQTTSVLSIPDEESSLRKLIRDHWAALLDVTDESTVSYLARPGRIDALADFSPADVLRAIEEERASQGQTTQQTPDDIKLPEWEIFSGQRQISPSRKLETAPLAAPSGFEDSFGPGMQIPRLSEVRAMYGFTRISTQQELDLGIISEQRVAPLTRDAPTWLPAHESYGEGIFLRLREDRLQAWEQLPAVQEHDREFLLAHKAWRASRRFQDTDGGYPGLRFVLIHSLAHALMQQITLDCGYTAASVRERLYCRTPDMPGGPMAGILLYTAGTDSEGTLGGLVSLGNRDTLGRYLTQALENMRLCTSDPLCAERLPEADGRVIQGAACHACLFAPETSCECGNRYLDRNVLVETFARRSSGLAFWK